MDSPEYGELHRLFDENFLDYTSYVIRERAIPDLADGLKPVQRRILQTLFNMDDGRFHKVANVVGECMKLHPHGDASIFAALVNLANKEYLIERQGNFGNIFTGDQASAPRYIECRLTRLARETMFNPDLTEFVDSYDGRMREPKRLPAKLPMLLLLGAEGIAVGMATRIMPHNFCELLEAEKAILRGEDFEIFPDFPKGGILDASQYDRGNGRLRCRARIEAVDEKTLVIREIPHTCTTESLIESVEKAVRAGRVKIQSINDYTAEEVEIEIKLARGIYASETIDALYAFTDCEVSISPSLTVIRDNTPVVLTVDDVLRDNVNSLLGYLEEELRIELGRLREKLHASLLEQIFIEERIYKQIEECRSLKAVLEAVLAGLEPFLDRLEQEVTAEDVDRLLEIRIKRISRYDINQKKKDIADIRARIKEVETDLEDIVGFTIRYIDGLLEKYGKDYPRRTELASFDEVVARRVALSNLTVSYDPDTGFLGSQVKGEGGSFACSEYDRVMLVYKNGLYKVINVAEKVYVGQDLVWFGKVEKGLVFNLVYRNGREGLSYVKRFRMPKFIIEREYRLFDEHPRSFIQYISVGDDYLRIQLAPSARAKSNIVELDMNDVLVKGAAAKGRRVSPRVVRKVRKGERGAASGEDAPPTLFGAGDKKE